MVFDDIIAAHHAPFFHVDLQIFDLLQFKYEHERSWRGKCRKDIAIDSHSFFWLIRESAYNKRFISTTDKWNRFRSIHLYRCKQRWVKGLRASGTAIPNWPLMLPQWISCCLYHCSGKSFSMISQLYEIASSRPSNSFIYCYMLHAAKRAITQHFFHRA